MNSSSNICCAPENKYRRHLLDACDSQGKLYYLMGQFVTIMIPLCEKHRQDCIRQGLMVREL